MLKLTDFSLSYLETQAATLKNINLHIKAGEAVLLTGQSGSGKSSLIQAINGLALHYNHAACQGQLTIAGKDVETLPLYAISRLVASVFQNPGTSFFNVNTTMELVFFLENMGIPKAEMDRRLQALLAVFPIEHLLNRDIFALSGGERQFLAIAAAYLTGSPLIVLDEPSANLDVPSIDKLANLLKILKAEGVSLLLAEHRLYYAMDIVDRVVVLQKGEIILDWPIAKFLAAAPEKLRALGLRTRERVKLVAKDPVQDGPWTIDRLNLKFKADHGLQMQVVKLQEKQIYGIVGPNGLGKSSFLRLIMGLEKGADLSYKGQSLSRRQRRRSSAWVMQEVCHQFFTDEVGKEIVYGLRNKQAPEITRTLTQLDLNDLLERHPLSLSGGQQQRLAIACALSSDRPLVFMDEPTSGMDYAHMADISALIRSRREEKSLIMLVSHDIEFLNMTVDQIIDLRNYAF